MHLAQQDELCNSVRVGPDNGILVKVGANGFGSFQAQAQSKIAFLSGPIGANFAAGALNDLQCQCL